MNTIRLSVLGSVDGSVADVQRRSVLNWKGGKGGKRLPVGGAVGRFAPDCPPKKCSQRISRLTALETAFGGCEHFLTPHKVGGGSLLKIAYGEEWRAADLSPCPFVSR